MPERFEIKHVGQSVIDDPVEVARIDRLEAEADRELARRPKDGSRKGRSTGGPSVAFRVSPAEQARLRQLAEAQGLSPNVTAKRIVLKELAKHSK